MTNTIPNVPRDDLDLIRAVLEGFSPCIARDDALQTVRALLSAPSPAGVDGCKCSMSIRVIGDGCRHCQPQEYIDRLGEMLDEERAELSDAQAIIDGLRDQIHVAHEKVGRYADQRDQQAKRIGELAGHLEFAVTILTVAGLAGNAQVEAMHAALSAGKEGE